MTHGGVFPSFLNHFKTTGMLMTTQLVFLYCLWENLTSLIQSYAHIYTYTLLTAIVRLNEILMYFLMFQYKALKYLEIGRSAQYFFFYKKSFLLIIFTRKCVVNWTFTPLIRSFKKISGDTTVHVLILKKQLSRKFMSQRM